jgi:hypothetical protein
MRLSGAVLKSKQGLGRLRKWQGRTTLTEGGAAWSQRVTEIEHDIADCRYGVLELRFNTESPVDDRFFLGTSGAREETTKKEKQLSHERLL